MKRGKSNGQSGDKPEPNNPGREQDHGGQIDSEEGSAVSRRVLLDGGHRRIFLKQFLPIKLIWGCGQLYEIGQLPNHSIYVDFRDQASATAFAQQVPVLGNTRFRLDSYLDRSFSDPVSGTALDEIRTSGKTRIVVIWIPKARFIEQFLPALDVEAINRAPTSGDFLHQSNLAVPRSTISQLHIEYLWQFGFALPEPEVLDLLPKYRETRSGPQDMYIGLRVEFVSIEARTDRIRSMGQQRQHEGCVFAYLED